MFGFTFILELIKDILDKQSAIPVSYNRGRLMNKQLMKQMSRGIQKTRFILIAYPSTTSRQTKLWELWVLRWGLGTLALSQIIKTLPLSETKELNCILHHIPDVTNVFIFTFSPQHCNIFYLFLHITKRPDLDKEMKNQFSE